MSCGSQQMRTHKAWAQPPGMSCDSHYIAAAEAVDRELVDIFCDFLSLGAENGLMEGRGRDLKRFLGGVGFILAEFGPKRSHGDPVRDPNCGFGTDDW